jgi:predicted metalloprotease with PDZ domain
MMRSIPLFLATFCATAVSIAFAQQPVATAYTISIDSADLSTFNVQMRIRHAPAEFTVAAHAHPEYDDKYWRFLEDMRAEGAVISRQDSTRWQVSNAAGDVTIRYRIRPPAAPMPRAAWRAFLTPQGGVVGGPHAFLYVVGAENDSAAVNIVLPRGWTTATGMTQTTSGAFSAADIFTLMESPIMVGELSEWRFDVANVPHHVFYLRGAEPVPFDTTEFVSSLRKIVQQSVDIFGKVPYERYVFMFVDNAFGGLEHPNSATLGAPSTELAKNPHTYSREIAHEFFHTWNLMRIKPIEYRKVDYRVQPPVSGLWFSEGLSIFYSDLMMRRAGFIMPEPTRTAHLASILTRYMNDPAYDRFSAEEVSRTEYNSPPGALGNYDPGSHLIGEVIGVMLDLIVRAATNGNRNMDDVMRLMDERFAKQGFTSNDVEKVVSDVCGCTVKDFFDRHVRGGTRIDINRYLQPFGVRMVTTRAPVVLDSGEVDRDLRIRAWQPTPQDTLRLWLWTPESIWARAGLNTNDRVLSVNGVPVRTGSDFRAQIAAIQLGGTARLEVVRPAGKSEVTVIVSGYERQNVRVEEIPDASQRARRLRTAWSAGR